MAKPKYNAEKTAESNRRYRLSPHGRYSRAVTKAIARDVPFLLNFDEWSELVEQECAYCAGALEPQGIGLDRLDNSLGYVLGNVVPCCAECNRIRSNKYTPQEMILLGVARAMLKEGSGEKA